MKETVIIELKPISLRNPILVTGLPGVGLIGQIVARYLIKELKGEKFAELYSPHFPSHALMLKTGTLRLIKNVFYCIKLKDRDLILLTGDVQASTSEGQYEIVGKVLDYLQKLKVKEILTIGGYSTGIVKEERGIFGCANNTSIIKKYEKEGVVFGRTRGAVVGIAGLLPSLAKIRKIHAVCIMGETHGGYIDVFSAKNVISFLAKMLKFDVDLTKLEKQAKKGEKVIKKIEEEIKKHTVKPYAHEKEEVSYIR